jgi:hypothetical protein
VKLLVVRKLATKTRLHSYPERDARIPSWASRMTFVPSGCCS